LKSKFDCDNGNNFFVCFLFQFLYPVYLIIVVEEDWDICPNKILKNRNFIIKLSFFCPSNEYAKTNLRNWFGIVLFIHFSDWTNSIFFKKLYFSINNFLDSWGLDEMILFFAFQSFFIDWNFHLSMNSFFPFNWNREEKIVQNNKTNISSNFDAFKFIAILASHHLQTMTFRIENRGIVILLSWTF
jgi:hypothetical protein